MQNTVLFLIEDLKLQRYHTYLPQMKAKYFVLAALLAGAVSLSAEPYYWTGAVKNKLFDDINNWAMDKDGTTPVTSTPTTSDIIDISNIATSGDGSQIGLGTYTELGDISNTGGKADFEIFNWGSDSVLNAGNITQNSSERSLNIRGRAGYTGFDVTVGGVDVLQGIMRFGNRNAGTALTNLTVNGAVNISSGTYLNSYVTDSLVINGDITNNGGMFQIVPTDDQPVLENQIISLGNITSEGGEHFIYSYNGGTIGDVSITDGSFKLYAANSGTSEQQVFNVRSVSVINNVENSANALNIGDVGVHYSYDALRSIKTFNTGDLYYKMNHDTQWSVNNLNVKADLFEGATGTMSIDAVGNNRARFVIQNMDVDNLVVGRDGGASVTAFEMSDATNEFLSGTVKIGSLDVKDNIENFRLGYLFVAPEVGNSYTKYQNIEIGELSVYKTAELYGEQVSVGSITKNDGTSVLQFGRFEDGNHSSLLSIGTDSSSVSQIYGGTLSMYTSDLEHKGTLLLAPKSENRVDVYLNNVGYVSGVYENQVVNMDTIIFDSTNADVSASIQSEGITSLSINKVSMKGGHNSHLHLRSSEGIKLGYVSAESYIDASGAEAPSTTNVLQFYGTGDVEIGSVVVNGFDDLSNRNAMSLRSPDNDTSLHIENVEVSGGGALYIGGDVGQGFEFSSVTIDKLVQGGLNRDRYFGVRLADSSGYVNIGEMSVTSGIARLNGNANYDIGVMNLAHGGSGAAELSGTSVVKVGTLNKTGGGTMRFGGASASISGVEIGEYNMSNSGWVAFYTPDGGTNIDIVNVIQGGTLQFYSAASIGSLNVAGDHTVSGVLQSGDNLLTIGQTDISGAVSFDGNVKINDSINIKSGGILTLSTTTDGYTVTAKGITGNTGTWTDRVQTSRSVNLVLDGDDGKSYYFDGRIMDFSATQSDPAQLGGAILSLTVNSGKQILASVNNYRGTTTVNGGILLLNGVAQNESGTTLSGIVLKGGSFGAVGRSADIGEVMAQSLSWSNGATMLFDINSETEFDQIILSGALTKGTSDAEGLYNFEFTITNGDIAGQEFALITFDSTDFSTEDFSGSFTNMGDNWSATFDIRDNTVYATIIPEPSTYAAILGVIMLFAAYMRKRKINLK